MEKHQAFFIPRKFQYTSKIFFSNEIDMSAYSILNYTKENALGIFTREIVLYLSTQGELQDFVISKKKKISI